jgi:hypothetical protein
MKKKFMTAVVAASLAAMTVGTVAFASESPTSIDYEYTTADNVDLTIASADEANRKAMADATTVTSTIGEALNVAAVGETSVLAANRAANNLLTESRIVDLADLLDDADLFAALKSKDQGVTANVLSVVNITPKSDDFTGTITIKNDNIKAGKSYVVLHYVTWTDWGYHYDENGDWVYGEYTNGDWYPVAATKVKDGQLNVKVDSFSVFAIVELSTGDFDEDGELVVTETPAVNVPAAGTTANGQTTTVSTGAGSSSSSSDSSTTSPKTGEY